MLDTTTFNSTPVVSSLATTEHLIATDASGKVKRITRKNAVSQDVEKGSLLSLNGGEWVRVAKAKFGSFSAILSVTHGWSSGRPAPLLAVITGASGNADGYHAEKLTSSAFFKVERNPPASSNPGLSFTALRFVKDTNNVFIEVRFKPNAKASSLYVSLTGQTGDITVIPAEISNAAAADVLKTIDFSASQSGGGNALHYRQLRFTPERRWCAA